MSDGECVLGLGRYDDVYSNGIHTISIQPLRDFIPERIVIPKSIGMWFSLLSVNVNGLDILDFAKPVDGMNAIPAELAMSPGIPFFKHVPMKYPDSISVIIQNMDASEKRFVGMIVGREASAQIKHPRMQRRR